MLAIAFLTAIGTYALWFVAYPSPELLRAMAGVGASFFLAYVIETTWMVSRAPPDDSRGDWLGFVTGLAVAGLIGIAAALLSAEHRAAGHGNLLDDLGMWWSVFSLGFLGLMVALQPHITHTWMLSDRAPDGDQ
jgi:high-affinity Fe2+/Pb2+ permease